MVSAIGRIENKLAALSGDIGGILGAIANIVESIVSLIRDPIVAALGALEAAISGLYSSLTAFIEGFFDGLTALINGAFAAQKAFIDGVFGSLRAFIDGLFGNISSDLASIEGTLSQILSRIGNIESALGSLSNRLGEIQGTLNSLNSRLADIQSSIGGINNRLSGIEQRLGGIDGKLADIQQQVYNLAGQLQNIWGRLDGIASRLGQIESAISSLNSALNAIEAELRSLGGYIDSLRGEVNAIPGEVWGYGLSCGPAGSAVCRSLSAAEDPEKNFSDDDRQKLDDIKDDLDDLGNELEAIAKVTGVPDFPGKLPNSLLGDGSGQTEVESIPQFMVWITKQMDALIGEFPIEVEVKSEDGDRRVKLRNIAETMAELYTQGVFLTTINHAQTNALVRTGNELMSLKVAVLVAQDLIMAANEFLGFRMKKKTRKTNFSFTPKTSDKGKFTLIDFLDSYEGQYQGWEFDDQEILIEYLPQLLYGVSLVKAATLRGQDDIDQLQDQVEEILKDGETAWDRFRNLVNNPDSEYNLGESVKFRIEDRNVEDEK
ncbi:phage tail protein [Picosynechococcus sp. PCC 11901]|uniref:phage tail protein n=1 Tax=Picosynechococcus sp. PCC 11901 TaxID=2579791 RepID=UPI0030D9EF3E